MKWIASVEDNFVARSSARSVVICLGRELGTDNRELLLMDRIAMLNEILLQNPNDAFARYGLAIEYSKTGEVERALEEFGKLLSTHPDYTAGYFMAAQTLVTVNRVDEAKKMLVDGISSARRTNNAHAQSEMTTLLDELK
jgi:predicted Zn-dependent protease